MTELASELEAYVDSIEGTLQTRVSKFHTYFFYWKK